MPFTQTILLRVKSVYYMHNYAQYKNKTRRLIFILRNMKIFYYTLTEFKNTVT